MAKSAKRKTVGEASTAADHSSKLLTDGVVHVTGSDISRRAYDLYLARGCEHGHDVDDWVRAERDLLRADSTGKLILFGGPHDRIA